MAVPRVARPIEVYAGDDFAQTFRFRDDDGGLEDLSDCTDWEAEFRTETKVIALTVDDSFAATGEITVEASSAQTRAMGADGVIDIQAVRDGKVRTFIRFLTTWQLDVTR